MILGLYGFYDKKSQEVVNPTFFKNDDVLKRELSKALSEPNNNHLAFLDFPDDFDLYQIGTFDTNCVNKENIPFVKPRLVCNLAELKKKE